MGWETSHLGDSSKLGRPVSFVLRFCFLRAVKEDLTFSSESVDYRDALQAIISYLGPDWEAKKPILEVGELEKIITPEVNGAIWIFSSVSHDWQLVHRRTPWLGGWFRILSRMASSPSWKIWTTVGKLWLNSTRCKALAESRPDNSELLQNTDWMCGLIVSLKCGGRGAVTRWFVVSKRR